MIDPFAVGVYGTICDESDVFFDSRKHVKWYDDLNLFPVVDCRHKVYGFVLGVRISWIPEVLPSLVSILPFSSLHSDWVRELTDYRALRKLLPLMEKYPETVSSLHFDYCDLSAEILLNLLDLNKRVVELSIVGNISIDENSLVFVRRDLFTRISSFKLVGKVSNTSSIEQTYVSARNLIGIMPNLKKLWIEIDQIKGSFQGFMWNEQVFKQVDSIAHNLAGLRQLEVLALDLFWSNNSNILAVIGDLDLSCLYLRKLSICPQSQDAVVQFFSSSVIKRLHSLLVEVNIETEVSTPSITEKLLNQTSASKFLKSLALCDWNMDSSALSTLCNFIKTQSFLEHLEFADKSQENWIDIFESLVINKNIHSLKIAGRFCSGNNEKVLIQLLRDNKLISHLNLDLECEKKSHENCCFELLERCKEKDLLVFRHKPDDYAVFFHLAHMISPPKMFLTHLDVGSFVIAPKHDREPFTQAVETTIGASNTLCFLRGSIGREPLFEYMPNLENILKRNGSIAYVWVWTLLFYRFKMYLNSYNIEGGLIQQIMHCFTPDGSPPHISIDIPLLTQTFENEL
jgi:hypothetical protein